MLDTSKTLMLLGLAVAITACDTGPKPAPPIGEAFVGPYTLQVRGDVTATSKGLATVQHGERLEILQQRRRAVKVRTAKGAEGWVDERQLLAASDMAELRQLAGVAKGLPSQGKATTYVDLNVHTQPSRQAPSFIQLKEGGSADVLLYRSFPRTDSKRKPLIPPVPKQPKKAIAKKPPKEQKVPPPPMPKPPGPPADWLELSKTDYEDDDDPPPDGKAATPVEVPIERWALLRMPNGAAGWVLSRLISMGIPDEVAQYAEGKRIVAYFPMGEVETDGKKHNHWLWTTASAGHPPYDFDGVRLFTWNIKRRRYETAYIDRKVRGFIPVIVKEVEWQGRKVPGFSLCVLNDEEQRVRRDFAFVENRVRSNGEQPCEAPPAVTQKTPAPTAVAAVPAPEPQQKESVFQRFRERVKSAARGVWGR